MRAGAHAVRDVPREHPPQPSLVRDDHVIQALASDRADDALDVGVLPRRARRGADRLDVHAGERCRGRCERAIPIMQKIGRRRVVREGVPELLGGPRRSRMVGHRDVHKPSPVVGEDDEHKEQPEGDGRHDEEVGCHNLVGVVA